MKHKPLKAPKGRKGVAKQLRWLAEHMKDIGVSMDYYGGFNVEMVRRGNMLIDDAMVLEKWAREIKDAN